MTAECVFCGKSLDECEKDYESLAEHSLHCYSRGCSQHSRKLTCFVCGLEDDNLFPERSLKACRGCGTLYANHHDGGVRMVLFRGDNHLEVT